MNLLVELNCTYFKNGSQFLLCGNAQFLVERSSFQYIVLKVITTFNMIQ